MDEQEDSTGRVTDTLGQVQEELAHRTHTLLARLDGADDAQATQDDNIRELVTRVDEQEAATCRVTDCIGRLQREHADMTTRLSTRIHEQYNLTARLTEGLDNLQMSIEHDSNAVHNRIAVVEGKKNKIAVYRHILNKKRKVSFWWCNLSQFSLKVDIWDMKYC